MVERSVSLDLVFGALADPTRRRILEILLRHERRVGEIAESFSMSLAAVSKHLRVLERANLISRRKDGRVHHLKAEPDAVASAHAWITQYAQGWNEGLDALEHHLDSEHGEKRVTRGRGARAPRKGTRS